MEIEHQRYMEGKHKCEEIEKKVRKVQFNMKKRNDNLFVCLFVCLFDLILYVPSTIFQLNRDGSSWVEPVLS